MKSKTYIKGIANFDSGEYSSMYNVTNICVRIGYFKYIDFETSVAQKFYQSEEHAIFCQKKLLQIKTDIEFCIWHTISPIQRYDNVLYLEGRWESENNS